MKGIPLVMAIVCLCLGTSGCSFFVDSYNVTETMSAKREVVGDSTGRIYSRAIKAQGEFVFTSGQIPIDPETREALYLQGFR